MEAATPSKATARKTPAREAWAAIFELFGRYKPTMLAIQGEYGLRPPMVFAMKELDEPKPMGKIAGALHCDNSAITWITGPAGRARVRRAPGRSQGPPGETDRADRRGPAGP